MSKKQFLISVLAWSAVPFLLACPKGTSEYEGNCAADIPAEQAVQTFVPSNEKPRRSQQPEWQTGAVTAAMPPSEASKDAKLDAERTSADNEGKKAAGLN